MILQWTAECLSGKFTIHLKSPVLWGRETRLTLDGETWFLRPEASLNCVFLRREGEKLEKVLSLADLLVSGDSGDLNRRIDLSMTSCPASHIKALVAVSGPETLFRQKNRQNRSLGIRSPMTGKILKICVKEGEEIREGAVVAVIEAMKMENNIHAPGDGVVGQILAAQDAAVMAGAELMRLIPIPEP